MNKWLRGILVLALTLGLVALFLRNADFGRVWAEVRQSRLELLLLALVATSMTYVLRALRWQYLLAPIGHVRFGPALKATIIGFSASFLLPARAGEFIRPYLLARREGLSATAAFATIVVERLLDLVTVLVFLGAFLWVFDPGVGRMDPGVFRAVRAGGITAALTATAGVVLLMWLAAHPAALSSLSAVAARLLPEGIARRVEHLLGTFRQGLGVLREPRRVLLAVVWSVPLWLSIAAGIWLASRAFHIEVPFTGSFLLMAVLVVGVSVPTPGSVGGYHAAYRIGVTAFYAAPDDRAIGAAIVLHALSFLPVTLVGIVLMAQEGLSLGGARKLASLANTEDRS